MTQQWLLGWWNLIFILPFGLGLLYLGIYTLSGWTFGEADADVDHDVSVDHDVAVDGDASVDGDAPVEHDADLSHDVGADADSDADADHEAAPASHAVSSGASHGSYTFAALSWLGVGRVPVSLILMILLLTWGLIGFAANQLMIEKTGKVFPVMSIAVAFVVTLLLTRIVTSLVARYLPTSETYARRLDALLGCSGEALYAIDSKFGMVCGQDDRGEYYQFPCRTLPDRPAIAKGTKVILAVYDEKSGLFSVIPAEAGDSDLTPRVARRRSAIEGR